MITTGNEVDRTKMIQMIVEEETNIKRRWKETTEKDTIYQKMLCTLRNRECMFLIHLIFKVSISECSVDNDLIIVRFCDRKWMLSYDNLQIELIQLVYNSTLRGHPEREDIYMILAQKYFWPNMVKDIRKFTDNCDSCEANKAGRHGRQGLLKPLLVLNRIWWKLSMDFIMGLLNNNGYMNMIVITDRLLKGIITDGLKDIVSETIAKGFLRQYFLYYSLSYAIISDRETQFVNDFWTQIYMKLRIKRRLNIISSPETDGSTEYMNQEIENYLQEYMSFVQDNGLDWLDIATNAINVQDFFLMRTNLFFMEHGGHLDMINIELRPNNIQRSSITDADRILHKLQDIREGGQSAMALAQQGQEEAVNQKGENIISFKVDDKVWLNLTNINTNQIYKKLNAKYIKFTILKAVDIHVYHLNIPSEIHNVFHMKHLRLIASDPLSGQIMSESQSVGIVNDIETVEYEMKKILKERKEQDNRMKYLMKWTDYARPTWKSRDTLEETSALNI